MQPNAGYSSSHTNALISGYAVPAKLIFQQNQISVNLYNAVKPKASKLI
jgi:hypothetical protein